MESARSGCRSSESIWMLNRFGEAAQRIFIHEWTPETHDLATLPAQVEELTCALNYLLNFNFEAVSAISEIPQVIQPLSCEVELHAGGVQVDGSALTARVEALGQLLNEVNNKVQDQMSQLDSKRAEMQSTFEQANAAALEYCQVAEALKAKVDNSRQGWEQATTRFGPPRSPVASLSPPCRFYGIFSPPSLLCCLPVASLSLPCRFPVAFLPPSCRYPVASCRFPSFPVAMLLFAMRLPVALLSLSCRSFLSLSRRYFLLPPCRPTVACLSPPCRPTWQPVTLLLLARCLPVACLSRFCRLPVAFLSPPCCLSVASLSPNVVTCCSPVACLLLACPLPVALLSPPCRLPVTSLSPPCHPMCYPVAPLLHCCGLPVAFLSAACRLPVASLSLSCRLPVAFLALFGAKKKENLSLLTQMTLTARANTQMTLTARGNTQITFRACSSSSSSSSSKL